MREPLDEVPGRDPPRRLAQGGVRRLRCVRPGPARRPPDLPGPVRPPAPRAGVGGHGGQRRRAGHRGEGHGPGVPRVRRPDPGSAHRPPGHRPHPLLHHRFQHVAQRPTGVPRGRLHPVRAGPQRQPGQHGRAGRRGRHAPGHGGQRQRPGGRTGRGRTGACRHRRRSPRGAGHPGPGGAAGGRPRCRGLGGPAPPRRCVLVRVHGREPGHRGARSQRLPAAVPRPHRRRLGHGVGVTGPRRGGRPLRARGRAGRDGHPGRSRGHLAETLPEERLNPSLCIFEFVYFARPDTRLYGRSVHHARVRQGELLAEQAPVEADMVMGVPESGLPAAEGYARASGIPYGQGLVKNRYIGRTFIAPSQEMRALGVRMKLNPLRENLAGKRVVVVDDSVVRGTTQKQLVKMLREAGVTEVHLRLTSPPIKWSCFYGIDTGRRSELLAANLTVEEIRDYLDVDTLAFITLDRLVASTGTSGAGFCDACFTGEYPVAVPVTLTKGVLEAAPERPVGTGAPIAGGLFSSDLLPADDARRR